MSRAASRLMSEARFVTGLERVIDGGALLV
jgi:hypothetical protein